MGSPAGPIPLSCRREEGPATRHPSVSPAQVVAREKERRSTRSAPTDLMTSLLPPTASIEPSPPRGPRGGLLARGSLYPAAACTLPGARIRLPRQGGNPARPDLAQVILPFPTSAEDQVADDGDDGEQYPGRRADEGQPATDPRFIVQKHGYSQTSSA